MPRKILDDYQTHLGIMPVLNVAPLSKENNW